jgi:hypothetical protein
MGKSMKRAYLARLQSVQKGAFLLEDGDHSRGHALWHATRRILRRMPWPAILFKVAWAVVIWFIDPHHSEWW